MGKTILYIGGFELPDKNAAAQRVLGNSAAFKELGYDVIFLGITKKKEELKKCKEVNSFKYYERLYPKNIFQWLMYLTSIKDFFETLKNNKTIKYVICYNYPAIALWRLKNYCKKNNIKIIADTTEWYEAKGNIIYKTIKNIDTFLRMRIIQPKLDGIIVASQYLYEFYKYKNNKLLILPSLVDLREKKWNLDRNVNKNFIKVIYAGSTGPGKDELRKTIELLSLSIASKINFKFIIIGLSIEEYKKIFKIDKICGFLEKKVFFYGRMEHLNVLKEISSSDFYIFFRENNLVCKAGFPTKYSESISCGTPVITNKTSNIEDYLNEGKNGFFLDINNKLAAIEKINYILSLPKNKIIEMKENCHKCKQMDYHNFMKECDYFFKQVDNGDVNEK